MQDQKNMSEDALLDVEPSSATEEQIVAVLDRIDEEESAYLLNMGLLEETRKKWIRQLKKLRALDKEFILPEIEKGNIELLPLTSLGPEDCPAGDVNFLMTSIPLTVAPFDKIISVIARVLITHTHGLMPEIEVQSVKRGDQEGDRIVVRWNMHGVLSRKQLFGIWSVCRTAYERDIHGHKDEADGWETVVKKYTDVNNRTITGRVGIYFGPQSYFSSSAIGIVASRKFARASEPAHLMQKYPEDWIARSLEYNADVTTQVELRDGVYSKEIQGLSQENFLYLVVQISHLLATKKLFDKKKLMTVIFKALNQIGTARIEREKLYGMKSVLQTIEKVLLLPLQRVDLARAFHLNPESVILVGVPGVGKTFISHFLMTGDFRAIFVSIESDKLYQDLKRSGDTGASSILLRVDKLKESSALPIILLIDDVDVILQHDMVPKFLNMMQGIRQKGFHLIASTNYPEKIDERLFEPGRISVMVHVGLPEDEDRNGVLTNYLADIPFESAEEKIRIIDDFARTTKGWTQRYLRELCAEAGRLCALEIMGDTLAPSHVELTMKPLQRKHFQRAKEGLLRDRIDITKIRERDKKIKDFVSRRSIAPGQYL